MSEDDLLKTVLALREVGSRSSSSEATGRSGGREESAPSKVPSTQEQIGTRSISYFPGFVPAGNDARFTFVRSAALVRGWTNGQGADFPPPQGVFFGGGRTMVDSGTGSNISIPRG